MGHRRCIDGVRSGDARAWAELVHVHYQRIYRMLAHLTRGDRHTAEDLCQETFAAAWANIASFAGDCAIGTWLHRIAYRKFLDARRAKKPPPPPPPALPPPPASPTPQPAPDALAGLIVDEETRQLHAAIDRMEEAERIVLVLHYLQDLSYREMAAVTGEPVGTIKWRTKVALERLGELLRAAETFDGEKRDTSTDRAAAGDALADGPARA